MRTDNNQTGGLMKKHIGFIAILVLIGLVVVVSGCTSSGSDKSTAEQVKDAKEYVEYVDSSNVTLSAEEQEKYDNAKELIAVDEAGKTKTEESKKRLEELSSST